MNDFFWSSALGNIDVRATVWIVWGYLIRLDTDTVLCALSLVSFFSCNRPITLWWSLVVEILLVSLGGVLMSTAACHIYACFTDVCFIFDRLHIARYHTSLFCGRYRKQVIAVSINSVVLLSTDDLCQIRHVSGSLSLLIVERDRATSRGYCRY